MPETHLIQSLLQFWLGLSVCVAAVGLFNIPVLLMFALSRRWQLLRPDFGSHFNAPAHWLLNWICIPYFGVLLPVFYYVNIRERHRFAIWELGDRTNNYGLMALGAVLILWLSAHIAEAALRRGRIRIRHHPLNIAAGAAAVALCGWYHLQTIPAQIETVRQQSIGDVWEVLGYLAAWLIYPQSFFFGASLVYLTALLEALKGPPAPSADAQAGPEAAAAAAEAAPRDRRRRIAAAALAAVFVLAMFSPFWLGIPRVPHRQAMTLLVGNRAQILEIAESARLDPLLMAGIVYVAHTRDQPRFTGEWIDRIGYQAAADGDIMIANDDLLINPSVGLCQMKLTTMKVTNEILPVKSSNYFYNYTIRYSIENAQAFAGPLNRERSRHLVDGGYFADRIPILIDRNKTLIDDPELSLLFAAAMLKALELHWEEAGHPIAGRPEILATLYNIGYENSEPKAEPRANDFGRRVKAFMESEHARAWLEGKSE